MCVCILLCNLCFTHHSADLWNIDEQRSMHSHNKGANAFQKIYVLPPITILRLTSAHHWMCLFTQGTHTLMDTQNTLSLSLTHTYLNTHTHSTCMCAHTHVHNLRRQKLQKYEHYITKLVLRVSRNTPFVQSTVAAGVLVVIDTIIRHTSWSNKQTVTNDCHGSVTCRKIKRIIV